ncbi:histone H3 [Pseudolycoriella hygida]|uniref:Histone H3 n=1 Tax=Pseudolycoriella hygida TaxID=35572 RepID=A0A9Q0S415_9DIPT|nr:histone H3 [Pseudolycoriella hygida]
MRMLAARTLDFNRPSLGLSIILPEPGQASRLIGYLPDEMIKYELESQGVRCLGNYLQRRKQLVDLIEQKKYQIRKQPVNLEHRENLHICSEYLRKWEMEFDPEFMGPSSLERYETRIQFLNARIALICPSEGTNEFHTVAELKNSCKNLESALNRIATRSSNISRREPETLDRHVRFANKVQSISDQHNAYYEHNDLHYDLDVQKNWDRTIGEMSFREEMDGPRYEVPHANSFRSNGNTPASFHCPQGFNTSNYSRHSTTSTWSNPPSKSINNNQDYNHPSGNGKRNLERRTEPILRMLRRPYNILLVKEIMQRYKKSFQITTTALKALQEAVELYLTYLFSDAYLMCNHRQRVTLERLVLHMRQEHTNDLNASDTVVYVSDLSTHMLKSKNNSIIDPKHKLPSSFQPVASNQEEVIKTESEHQIGSSSLSQATPSGNKDDSDTSVSDLNITVNNISLNQTGTAIAKSSPKVINTVKSAKRPISALNNSSPLLEGPPKKHRPFSEMLGYAKVVASEGHVVDIILEDDALTLTEGYRNQSNKSRIRVR